jgi:hypothetical protein
MLERREAVAAHIKTGFAQAERGVLTDGDAAVEMLRQRRAQNLNHRDECALPVHFAGDGRSRRYLAVYRGNTTGTLPTVWKWKSSLVVAVWLGTR